MAMLSGLFTQVMQYGLSATAQTGTPTAIDFTSQANIKISLHNDSESPDFDAASPAWVNTNEVTGSGWATGGIVLNVAATGGTACNPAFSAVATETLKYDMVDVSVASTTLSGVYGCILYFPSITAPVNKPMFLAVDFTSPYSTNNGTFGIQWSGSGVFTIDCGAN